MPNYRESLGHLESFVSARVPLIALRTMEQQRALRLLREIASSPGAAPCRSPSTPAPPACATCAPTRPSWRTAR